MNTKTSKELRRISENIPKELMDRLMKERYEYPTIRKVVNKALKDDEVDEVLKERLRHIKDIGAIDKKTQVVNRTAEKEIDEWMKNEVEKAIKLGRIPHPKDDKDLQAYIKKIHKKHDKNKKGDNQN